MRTLQDRVRLRRQSRLHARNCRTRNRAIQQAAPRALPGLLDRAVARFPDDAPLALEQAMAAAGRFNVTVDGGRLADSAAMLPPAFAAMIPSVDRRPGAEAAVAFLTPLRDDPQVGVEARIRLGYLYWALGHDNDAAAELKTAAERAADVDLRYLASFLAGWTALARGDGDAAGRALQAALEARPGSQSASVALSALELQRGNADLAHDIARRSLDQRRAEMDPWRLFLYGHHPQWAARLAELRRLIAP